MLKVAFCKPREGHLFPSRQRRSPHPKSPSFLLTLRAPKHTWLCVAWLAVILTATFLRFNHIGERPIHADEATGARITAHIIEGEGYTFNPHHFHGPTLSYLALPVAGVRGESAWPELTLATLRIGPAIAGLLTCLVPLLWLRSLGGIPSLVAGAFLASSPLLVYYNRMFIHESWLALFGLLTLTALYRFGQNPKYFNAMLVGVCLGLMFATKETFAISALSWIPAILVLFSLKAPEPGGHLSPLRLIPRHLPAASLAGAVAVGVGAVWYTGFLSHPAGIVDAFKTFFVYETTPGHEKPIYYYGQLLLWPKAALGVWWTEIAVGLFAILSVYLAWRLDHKKALVYFLAVSSLVHIAIYSLISYKTPWLMLLPWAHTALLAGTFFIHFAKLNQITRSIAWGCLAIALCYQTYQSNLASGRFENDQRNPYAYIPTSRNAAQIGVWLEAIQVLPGAPPMRPLAVAGEGHWPVPWFLREFDTVGYWPNIKPEMATYPVILAMPEAAAEGRELLADSHLSFPRSLRPNLSIELFLRKDLWALWQETFSE